MLLFAENGGCVRAILITISVLAGMVWSLDKIGVTPIAPGTNVHFSYSLRRQSSQDWLVLKSDAGTQKCWIRLVITGAFKTAPSLTAELATGKRLRGQIYPIGRNLWAIDLFNTTADKRARPMFDWQSGDRIFVHLQTSAPASLHYWTIYLDKGESDSLGKAIWRQQWFYISLFLLAISIAAGAYSLLKDHEKKTEQFTPQLCILQIVGDIETDNPDESAKIRKLLSRVLLTGGGGTIKEVMSNLGIPPKEQPALWFKARSQFLGRLDYLIEHLVDSGEKLRNEKHS
jgi:hypothetical protein